MDAVISGRAGKALILDDGVLTSFDLNDAREFVPRKREDVRLLLGESNDAIVIENVSREEIIHWLEIEKSSAMALDLTLISLDPELSDEVRMEAVEALDELLSDADVVARVEKTIYAKPLPAEADLMGALTCCERTNAEQSRSFFQRLEYNQPQIRKTRYAWESIPPADFGGAQLKSEFHDLAVREGLFRDLSTSSVDKARIGLFLLNALRNESVRTKLNHRGVLQQWSATLRDSAIDELPKLELAREAAEDLTLENVRERRRGRPHRRERGDAVLEKVLSQKGLIISAMKRHDYVRAHEVIEELIDFQRKNGKPEHLAKSLCDLAMEAKKLGNNALQLELTSLSVDERPDDAWSWTQHGDALLCNSRLDDAMRAFEEADAFGAGPVANTGRAEVLKAQGRLSEALEAFDTVIALHPDDVVAKTGRAEVLKAQGRLSEALEAFDAAIALHPENVVAKTGRAEVLKAQGRLIEALRYYDMVTTHHLSDQVAQNGRSCVLASLGRYAEALEHLPADNPSTESDWVGYHIRGMTLLRMGDAEAANQVFELGKEFCPWLLHREFFIASLALTRIRRREFADARELLGKIVAPTVEPQLRVLRVHTLGELKERERAIEVYTDLKSNPRPFSDELPDELYRRYIAEEGPLHDDEWVYQKEVDIFLLAA